MSFAAPNRANEPCDSYFGNVCTGFGARALCMLCGWDRHEHPDVRARFREIFKDALSERAPSDAQTATPQRPIGPDPVG